MAGVRELRLVGLAQGDKLVLDSVHGIKANTPLLSVYAIFPQNTLGRATDHLRMRCWPESVEDGPGRRRQGRTDAVRLLVAGVRGVRSVSNRVNALRKSMGKGKVGTYAGKLLDAELLPLGGLEL